MAGATVERFRFDRSFDVLAGRMASAAPPPPAVVASAPVITRKEVEQARTEGYARGRAEVEAAEEAHRAAEQEHRQSLDAIGAQLQAMLEDRAAAAEAASADAVLVAAAMVRRLLPHHWREGAAAEIEAMVREALAGLAEEPRITVRVAPDLHARLLAGLERVAAECGAEGRLRVQADAGISSGDCVIDWRGGGICRDQQAMWREIDRMIEAATGVAMPPQPSRPYTGELGE
ncbi:MAG: FliH/SctL family protein [Rhodospirillales bacterium]